MARWGRRILERIPSKWRAFWWNRGKKKGKKEKRGCFGFPHFGLFWGEKLI